MCVRGCTSVCVRPCEQESGDRPQRCPGPGQGDWVLRERQGRVAQTWKCSEGVGGPGRCRGE